MIPSMAQQIIAVAEQASREGAMRFDRLANLKKNTAVGLKHKDERLAEMRRLLRQNGPQTAEWVSGKLGVSTRTFFDYVQKLRNTGELYVLVKKHAQNLYGMREK